MSGISYAFDNDGSPRVSSPFPNLAFADDVKAPSAKRSLMWDPWQYDRAMYRRRNEVERLFRRLKGYRRIFSRFEKLDAMFLGFLSFVLVADGLRCLC